MWILTLAAATALFVYPILKRLIRSWALDKFTCVPDLEPIGESRPGGKLPGTAVICGGSLGGLFAARVCADHFEKVVVVEPDAWTFTSEAREPARFGTRTVTSSTATYSTVDHKRSRIYQYSAIHVYQAILLRFARKAFPGFDAIAKSWGMMVRGANTNLSINGHFVRVPEPIPTLVGPRRTLEPLLRKLVSDTCPNIEFIHGTVTGFEVNVDRSVKAVTVRPAEGETTDIACALAVDCTGVAQSGLKFLSRVIPDLPTDLRVSYNADIAYVTLEYPKPPNFDDDLRALKIPKYDTDIESGVLVYAPSPDCDTRFVGFTRNDEDSVVMTMGGWDVDMPVTLDEVRDFAKGVKNKNHIPDYFYKALDLLEPVKDKGLIFEARISSCYTIAYERAAAQLPPNFVALGDACMRVNPRFGQGVTKSSMGAITLDATLRRISPDSPYFGKAFFEKLASRTSSAWDGTRFADYAAPSTTPAPGETHESGKFMRWFTSQIVKASETNPQAAEAFFHNMGFLGPATDMFAPSILATILWQVVTGNS